MDARLDGLLKSGEAEASELDLRVGEGAAQAETVVPLKGARQRGAPDLALVSTGARGVAEALAPELKREHRVLGCVGDGG